MKRENISRGRTLQQALETLEEKKRKLETIEKVGVTLDYIGGVSLSAPICEAIRALILVSINQQIAALTAELEAL